MNDIYKKNIMFRFRIIGNKNILIGNSKTYELNETGKFIWSSIDGKSSVKDIKEQIINEYHCDDKVAEGDLKNFLAFLTSINAVKIS
ncbi:PqqD family protein [Bacillus aquiflavi]|uniref:PqqD family protein n=1 Tax=Bacillus aquiflavi TaxID=2672567 RepID=A0A6B3VUV3_9BACI|nr:PqqD family protein [Bacillus aquiflavi]MBA4536384.1 PqqD family protein [Bacillus aquiflavi]NEY80752.1 PqqD family protein [Bacillus aquiflavi]UAC48077.1 PqqD family protein [Bacillus aquiflavi]